MNQTGTESTQENRGKRGAPLEPTAEWSEPQPATIPPPTYWPVTLAFGTTVAALSLVTSYFFLFIGIPLMILALSGWVGELRR
jgi:hypothetical protein